MTAPLRLNVLRKQLIGICAEIEAWDKEPDNGFSEDQQLTLGNLCIALDNTEEYFNSALESFGRERK